MKNKNFILIYISFTALMLAACGTSTNKNVNAKNKDNNEKALETVKKGKPEFLAENAIDQDGNSYKMVKIGNQVWMAENLNVSHFRNGDPITENKTRHEWIDLVFGEKPAWCYYNYDSENGKKYGKLYTWFAVIDSRGLAPEGWHIPSEVEWKQLIDFLGGDLIAGFKMKSTTGWNVEELDDKTIVTNESGFSGLPGGRNTSTVFDEIGYNGYYWSSTDGTCYNLNSGGGKVTRTGDVDNHIGFSVRCVRN